MEYEEFPSGANEPAWPRTADVLVVDDDPVIRRVIVTMLEAAGFSTDEATTGTEAAAKLTTWRFDVVVSDIEMPDGTGLDLLRTIRRTDLDIPVVLVTGQPDVRSAAKAIEFGVFRYITKPIDFAVLEPAVRAAARAHAMARLRREAFAAAGGQALTTADRAGLEVRFGLALDGLWTAFQPIVGARSTALFGVEALLRSKEPSMPNPPAVLDAATRLGRMRELGRRTRALAVHEVGELPPGMFLFVNLHPDDLFDDELLNESSPLVRMASRVVLEITERATLQPTAALRDRLAALRERGYRMAIDDIGAGYSGLSSFADVMPEVVKIDMALVRGIHQSQIRQRTVRLLCNLCHECRGLVVGEGVETAEERDCLRELGCDLFQGYLFGRPAPTLPEWRFL